MYPLPSERATQAVKDRGEDYGPPTPIYRDATAMMNIWLEIPTTGDARPMVPSDGAVWNIFLKIARLKHGKQENEDHLTDVCGYANVFEMIAREEI